jgi:subtilisin family serine protease
MTREKTGLADHARVRLVVGLVLLCLAFTAHAQSVPGAIASQTWLVVTQSATMPAQELQNAIAPLGGTIVSAYPEVGAFVVAADTGFRTAAAAVPGVASVVPNVPLSVVTEGTSAGNGSAPTLSPANDSFYPFQWGLQAVRAKGAWDAGFTGAGVRVAILDTNFDITHPDLAPNIDPALPRSFVPGEPVTPPPATTFSHGTFVAGIIAATANGVGTVGVAPDAEIVPIKVVSDANSIQLPWFLDGIQYAVTVSADVVNMSFIIPPPRHRPGRSSRGPSIRPSDPPAPSSRSRSPTDRCSSSPASTSIRSSGCRTAPTSSNSFASEPGSS